MIQKVYSIISYQDPNDIHTFKSDPEDDEFIESTLDSSKRHRDKQIDDMEKFEQVESILAYLGWEKIVNING